MATGSGKTFTAVNEAYRLLKFCGAKRILFLVDRGNLGKQTEDEFANFTPPDDTRKFPDALHGPTSQEQFHQSRLRRSSSRPSSAFTPC
jgi:type I site-specific restriction endonuclease